MIAARSRPFLQIEVAEGISVSKLFVTLAALISLFVDQSFNGVYQSIQQYAGEA